MKKSAPRKARTLSKSRISLKPTVTNKTLWQKLTPKERLNHYRVTRVATRMREGYSLRMAAKLEGISPQSVLARSGDTIRKRRDGRYVVSDTDPFYRRVNIITTNGPVTVGIRGSRQATLAAQYDNAVGAYANGDPTKLAAFRGKKLGGYTLETKLDRLDDWAARGELAFEDLYEEPQ